MDEFFGRIFRRQKAVEVEPHKAGGALVIFGSLLAGAAFIAIAWPFRNSYFNFLRYPHMLTRLPGELILGPGGAEMPFSVYELAVSLLGIPLAALFYVPLFWFIVWRRNRAVMLAQAGREKGERRRDRIWLRLLKLIGIILLLFWIIRILAFVSGMMLVKARDLLGIPIHVQTVTYIDKPDSRPFLENGKEPDRIADFSTEKSDLMLGIWEGTREIRWLPDGPEDQNTLAAVVAQRAFMRSRKSFRHKVDQGSLKVRDLPRNVSRDDAMALDRLALDFLNSCVLLRTEIEALGFMKFSKDGNSVTYLLNIYSSWGPLSGYGEEHEIVMIRTNSGWLITHYKGNMWIS